MSFANSRGESLWEGKGILIAKGSKALDSRADGLRLEGWEGRNQV